MESSEWVKIDHCDAKFHIGIIQKNKDKQSTPNEPFIIRLYYPNVAKQLLQKKVAFNAITVQYEIIAAFKNKNNITRYNKLWDNNVIPVEIIRSRGVSSYVIPQFCGEELYLIAEKIPEVDLTKWINDFKVAYEKDQDVQQVKTLINNDLEVYCNNIVDNLNEVNEWSKKYELIMTAALTIIAYSTHSNVKQFSEMCFNIVFANYELIEELYEWLPTEVYDSINTKINKAFTRFKTYLKQANDLPLYLKNIFLSLASMEYIKSQFDKVENPIFEANKSEMEIKIVGFKNLLQEYAIE